MTMKKHIYPLLAFLMLLFTFTACGVNSDDTSQIPPDELEYNVTVEVECVENWIFNKYDVDVYIDDSLKGTVTHGDTEIFDLMLAEGSHILKFVSNEDDELDGEVELYIQKDEGLKYKISCSSSSIDIDTIAGTSSEDKPNNENQQSTTEYTLDYVDAESFEKALNDGVKVEGKIIQFEVLEYKPDSALGINCWAGEHLNFISEKELNVAKGNIIVGRIISEPTKSLGSWVIQYEVLTIVGEKIEDSTSEPSNPDEPTDTQPAKITVTMSEDDFIGMIYTDAEAKLREMGFTVFEYETLETEDINKPDDTIGAVEIKSWAFGKGDFTVGDTYEADAIVVLWYYICNEPVPNLTTENCPDLAALLSLMDPCDPSVATFASKYSGQVIEFDGCVTAMQNHGSYTTRWDVLLGAGDFDPNIMRGPNFRLTDVNYYNMNVSGGDSVYVGLNVHIVAKVGEYNSNTSLFELDIISMDIR